MTRSKVQGLHSAPPSSLHMDSARNTSVVLCKKNEGLQQGYHSVTATDTLVLQAALCSSLALEKQIHVPPSTSSYKDIVAVTCVPHDSRVSLQSWKSAAS